MLPFLSFVVDACSLCRVTSIIDLNLDSMNLNTVVTIVSILFNVFAIIGYFIIILPKKSKLNGHWIQHIYDIEDTNLNESVKRDRVRVVVRWNNCVTATAHRMFPESEDYKAWKFQGKLKGDILYGHYWGIYDNPKSIGVFFLKRLDDGSFAGYYLKETMTVEGILQTTTDANTIPLVWKPDRATAD